MISRHRLLVSLGTLSALRPLPGRAQTPAHLRVVTSPVNDVVPLLYANANGLFRAAGLEITIQTMSSGSASAAALVGAASEIAKVSVVPIINAHARGIPLAIVYPDKIHLAAGTTDTAMVVPPSSSARGARDLNGKTIGVPAIKDSTWITARVWQDVGGGNSATAHYIELPFAAVASAIETGRVDGAVLSDPYLTQGTKAGKVRQLGDPMAALGPRNLETAWVAMREYAGQNRDVINRFVRVVHDAQVWCNTHAAEAATLTAQFTGIDPATVATMHTVFATEIVPRDVQPWIAACAKYEIIPRAFGADELFL